LFFGLAARVFDRMWRSVLRAPTSRTAGGLILNTVSCTVCASRLPPGDRAMVATCGVESCFSIPTSYVSDFVDTVRGALGPVYAMRGVAQLKATPLLCGPGCRVTTSSALIPRGASPSHDGNYGMAMLGYALSRCVCFRYSSYSHRSSGTGQCTRNGCIGRMDRGRKGQYGRVLGGAVDAAVLSSQCWC